MAGFETTRLSPVGEAIREWRWSRFAPLYAAGIVAGVAIGIGVATWPGDGPALREHQPSPPSASSAAVIDAAPAFVLPSLPAPQFGTATSIELPLEYYPAMELVLAAPALPAEVPVAPAEAPVAPPAPQAAPAAAQAPAAPPVAPAQPVPAPAPVVETAAEPATDARPNFYVPAVSGGGASALELQLLNQINAERAAAGLAPYVLESGLTKVARTRSQQMVDQGYFAHRDPYGYSMYVELLAYFGYNAYAWAGENLAMNNWPAETAVDEAMRGLMNSPTHRANILAGDFTRIGIGEVTTSDRRHYFTMIFLS